jgi:adenylate cyclase
MTEIIKEHRGRVVDSPGDNVLAEFSSVVDAIECSVKIQLTLKARNANLPESKKMEFRIGINLGDVVEEEGRIYGDGVNIAARVEGLADGGGICISETVYQHIKDKVSLGYEYLGEQSVKNIPEPVRVYRVLMEPEYAGKVIEQEGPKPRKWRWAAIAAAAVIVIVVGVLAIWNFYLRLPPIEPASVEKMTYPLPEKPSIAVLAFENLSDDPKQEYLSDGISEAIISALSKVPQMFVIARNSSFTYKGKPVKVQQVAEELGVQYVLEGSVQRTGDKLRVTAQLIDALKGHHLWSERYDLKMDDLLDVQDEIAMNILAEMQVRLADGEQALVRTRETSNLKALEKHNEGLMYFKRGNRDDNFKARQLCEEAIRLDPNYPGAYRMVGWCHLNDVWFDWSQDPGKSLQLATEYAQKALALDENNSETLGLWGSIHMSKGEIEKAIEICRRAVEINPNMADTTGVLGIVLRNAGRYEEAISMFEKAIRLNPFPRAGWFWALGRTYWLAGRYEEAMVACKKALHIQPAYVRAYETLAAIYVELGQEEEARAAAAEVLRLDPKFSVERLAKGFALKDREAKERYLEALRKAGLPDKPPLPLPDKPSIAVLPFVNMSGDPEQEYFSDGITENIITALSKTPKLFVIARNSAFTYKGKQVMVQKVGKELGVRYVLEGSIQKSGERVRITAQLIDATTGNHLWAEKYDRDLKDIFILQDEITMKLLTALRVNLTEGETARIYSKGTVNLEAYLKVMKGLEHLGRRNKDDNAIARQLFKEAIASDPGYAGAYSALAWTYRHDGRFWTDAGRRAKSYERAIELAKKAQSLDDSDAQSHMVLCYVYKETGKYENAMAEGQRAIALEPLSADANLLYAGILSRLRGDEEAIELAKKALRLNPVVPGWYAFSIYEVYREVGRREEAIRVLKELASQYPDADHADIHYVLGMALANAGKCDEAIPWLKKAIDLNPHPPGLYFSRLAYAYRMIGQDEEAKEILKRSNSEEWLHPMHDVW